MLRYCVQTNVLPGGDTEKYREKHAYFPSVGTKTFHGTAMQVGRGKFSRILSLLSEGELRPEPVKRLLSIHEELVHITVEVNGRTCLKS
jgi:hypothetical protein